MGALSQLLHRPPAPAVQHLSNSQDLKGCQVQIHKDRWSAPCCRLAGDASSPHLCHPTGTVTLGSTHASSRLSVTTACGRKTALSVTQAVQCSLYRTSHSYVRRQCSWTLEMTSSPGQCASNGIGPGTLTSPIYHLKGGFFSARTVFLVEKVSLVFMTALSACSSFVRSFIHSLKKRVGRPTVCQLLQALGASR